MEPTANWSTSASCALVELGGKSTTNNTNLTNKNGRLGYRVIVRTYDHDELVARQPRGRSPIRKIRAIRGSESGSPRWPSGRGSATLGSAVRPVVKVTSPTI